MNQTVCTTIGQALSLLAFGIGLSFGLYFCIEAIVRECRHWGKWREARRLVRQAEATEAMKRYRADPRPEYCMRCGCLLTNPNGECEGCCRVDINMPPRAKPGTTESSLSREMQQLNDLMGGKK